MVSTIQRTMQVSGSTSMKPSPWIAFLVIPLVTLTGCPRTGPQEVDLTALREALSRVSAPPELWLDDYVRTELTCVNAGRLWKSFRKWYSKKTNGQIIWSAGVRVMIYCSEEIRIETFKVKCGGPQVKRSWIEYVFDELGRVCITRTVQSWEEGIFLSNNYGSWVVVQHGNLMIRIDEKYYGAMRTGKQTVIDDLTSRLLKAIEQEDAQRPPPPL